MARLKPLPKFLLIASVVGGTLTTAHLAVTRNWLPRAQAAVAQVPRVDTVAANPAATTPPAQPAAAGTVALPGTRPLPGTPLRMEVMAWNAQMGLMLANGGARSTEGSLMARHGVNLQLIRQDDTNQMQNNLLAFARELAAGKPQPASGSHFAIIMGDGAAAFFAGLNPQLAALGTDLQAEIIGAAGYSRGEDKCLGLPDWKANPHKARGAVIAGVLRDGDWNICLKWAADNGIANNPDEKTYDPDAINWVATDTYVDAGEKYIAGYCEQRPVVRQGQRSGDTRRVCVNGVATWTPVDVTIARHKGGLVSLASTREYRWQMPAVIVGNRRWMADNRAQVEGLLQAVFAGADQVRTQPEALRRAAEISAAVYREQNADYWQRYFTGVRETDKQGLPVDLGGSSVSNLADNLHLFGPAGQAGLYAQVYRVFGDLVSQQYPQLVPRYPAVEDVVNPRYLHAVAQQMPATAADMPRFSDSAAIEQVVSRRNVQIHFATGRAQFADDAAVTLRELAAQLTVAGNLAVEIHGHTDNVGTPSRNRDLSEARALAVKQWLEHNHPTAFPAGRIRTFAHGDSQFVAANQTAEGRAQNRRVEIVLGATR